MLATLAQLHPYAIGGMVVGFFIVCLLLILTVLIQRPQGGGLAGAFGSAAGSGQTAFGAKTGDALTIFTISMFVVYVLAAVGLNYAVKPSAAPTAAPAVTAPEPTTTGTPFQPNSGTTPAPGTLTPITVPGPTATPPAATPPAATTPATTPGTTPAPESAPATPGQAPAPTPADPKPADPKPTDTPK